MNAARMPLALTQVFARRKGSRLWDEVSNEYIDFICSYGPMLNGPTADMVGLAELMIETVPHAD